MDRLWSNSTPMIAMQKAAAMQHIHYFAGLDEFGLREILFTLRDDKELCAMVVEYCDSLRAIFASVLHSMHCTMQHMHYWRRTLTAAPLERFFCSVFQQGPLRCVSLLWSIITRQQVSSLDDNADLRLAILRDTFIQNAHLLGALHECQVQFRNIFFPSSAIHFALSLQHPPRHRAASSSSSSSSSERSSEDFIAARRESVQQCVLRLSKLLTSNASMQDKESHVSEYSLSSSDSSSSLISQFRRDRDAALINWTQNKIQPFVCRPSHFQRYWLKYLLYGVGAMCVAAKAVVMIRSGEMSRILNKVVSVISARISEDIIEPMGKLVEELSDTLRRREAVVAAEDLQRSKDSLSRMLKDYTARVAEGPSDRKTEILMKLQEYSRRIGIPFELDSSGRDTRVTSSNSDSVQMSDNELAMELLVKSYEAELPHPIRGIVFGNLMTAVLIQKLKVHTEAAMLTMDQVLASNELTVACTAAIPGILMIGSLIYGLYAVFLKPKRPNPGIETLPLRMEFSEVERVLTELAEAEQHLQKLTTRQEEENGANGNTINVAIESAASAVRQLNGMYHYHMFLFLETLNKLFMPQNARKKLPSVFGLISSIDSEFDGIRRDILELTSGVSAMRKIEVTMRMRLTYVCLCSK